MSEHLNAKELSQPKEVLSSLNFNPFTGSTSELTNRDRATANGAIGGASGLFPNAQELLNSLRQGQKERHNNETIPLGTVPYPPQETKSNKGV